MNEPIRVFLADDQALFRQGLRTLLAAHPDIDVIGEAGDGAEAVRLVIIARPDVVLMDLRMPIMDGVIATQHIKAQHPDARIIALTTFDDDQFVLDALRAGAVGYLLKDVSMQVLLEAIHAVAHGEGFLQPSITMKVIEAARQTQFPPPSSTLAEELTFRERDILRWLVEGMNNREIADRLVITEGTVKNHVSNIIGKLGVRDRTQAAIKAKELRLI
ncbi:MAG: response regulator transcription factor [Anaerolineae bacterium]|nr:response regulator transcription factor [Anaerolineae bacterium]